MEIIDFDPKYARYFYDLNIEWLKEHFYVEPYDEEVLSNPEEYIISKGGHILFAMIDAEIAGTAALINRGKDGFELSKMAVAPKFQGRKIGLKLMYACIYKSIALGTDRLFLDSNRKLVPAIALFNKVGFKEIPVPEDTPYERCNIRMEILF